MRIDLDSYREILDTLTRNKARSFLTGFGVFWGVFMLIGLMGGGKAMREQLDNTFEGFAQNTIIIGANQTTKPYKGFRKGRWWSMDYKDIERLKQRVPELKVAVPMIFTPWGGSNTAYYGDQKTSPRIQGTVPGDPCGKKIRVDSTYFEVIGVNYSTSNVSFNGRAEEQITMPITLMQALFNRGNEVDLIAAVGREGVVMSKITDRIRETVARAHYVDPTDEQGAMIFNTELLFQLMDNMFKGVNFLIWLVGLGTLLAGAIGVSNIMMVTVRERTTEIGIRRAIGATPKMILSQIISESILLTLVAGMSGILFGVMILQMLEVANTEDGIVNTHFQVGFWTAILAAVVVCTVGVLAGLAPAARAMSIKPVDAMRDE